MGSRRGRARRKAADAKAAFEVAFDSLLETRLDGADTQLHRERLETVTAILLDSKAVSVLDLGCGSGALLKRLAAEPTFTRIVGLDSSFAALSEAERWLNEEPAESRDRILLLHESFTTKAPALQGFDAAAMVETIEHIPPQHLSQVEQVVFGFAAPRLVVITTPNHEYNTLLGKPEGAYRHPEHEFEWSRAKFRSWASGVAARNGYSVDFAGIGPSDPLLGSPTQAGIFRLA